MTVQVQDEMLRDRDVAGWEPGVTDTQVARSRPADASLELVVRARRGDAAAFDMLTRYGIDHGYRLALTAAIRSGRIKAVSGVQVQGFADDSVPLTPKSGYNQNVRSD